MVVATLPETHLCGAHAVTEVLIIQSERALVRIECGLECYGFCALPASVRKFFESAVQVTRCRIGTFSST
jgi:hypothetical protein